MMLQGKKALIFGVANERSIAYGVAKQFRAQGAEIALSYQSDAIKKRVEPLAEQLAAKFIFQMDVSNDNDYLELPERVKAYWDSFDILVHSIAFADREDLKGLFLNTTRKGFLNACDISAFSLVGLTQTLQALINDNGRILSMTYYGSQKVVANYNVMGVAKAALEASTRYLANDLGERGITVNAISAGPVKTLAASGISGFRGLLSEVEQRSPLKRNISADDVGMTASCLASSYASAITGQTIYVDAGLSILGN